MHLYCTNEVVLLTVANGTEVMFPLKSRQNTSISRYYRYFPNFSGEQPEPNTAWQKAFLQNQISKPYVELQSRYDVRSSPQLVVSAAVVQPPSESHLRPQPPGHHWQQSQLSQ